MNTKPNHTPVPWKFSINHWPDGTINGEPYIYAPSAREHPTEGRHVATLCKLEEVEANGNLFAAAPELLAALEMFVRGQEVVPTPGLETELSAARAAIAKARDQVSDSTDATLTEARSDWQSEARAKAARIEAERSATPHPLCQRRTMGL